MAASRPEPTGADRSQRIARRDRRDLQRHAKLALVSGILVNNLGIFEPKPSEDSRDDDWRRFFEVHVLRGDRMTRLVLPGMRRANWGRVVFITSEIAVQTPAEMIHDGMTKTARPAVSRGQAAHAAGTGITVNSVLPGPTRSRGVGDFVDDMARASGKRAERVEAEFVARAPHLAEQAPCLGAGGKRRSWPRASPTSPARSPRRPQARLCTWTATSSRVWN